uniref:Uncharacterized protein n=1 Tax=Anguilla anguilla TaxID=7936 RepID=A0A0E9T7B2_ANGAN
MHSTAVNICEDCTCYSVVFAFVSSLDY